MCNMGEVSYKQLNGLVGALVDDLLPYRIELDGKCVQLALKDDNHPFRRRVAGLVRKYFEPDDGYMGIEHLRKLQTPRSERQATHKIFDSKRMVFLSGGLHSLPIDQPHQDPGVFDIQEILFPMDTHTVAKSYVGGSYANIDRQEYCVRYITNVQMAMYAISAVAGFSWPIFNPKDPCLFFVRKNEGGLAMLEMVYVEGNKWHAQIEEFSSERLWRPGTKVFFFEPGV